MAKEETVQTAEESASYKLTIDKTVPVIENLRNMVMQELSVKIADKMSTELVTNVQDNIRAGCSGCGSNCRGSCKGSCKGDCYSCKGDCSNSCRGDCAGGSGKSSIDNVSIKDIVSENLTKLTFAAVDSVRGILTKEGYPF